MNSLLEKFKATSHLSGGNAAFVEDLYERYLSDPGEVPEEWRAYFDGLDGGNGADVSHAAVVERFRRLGELAGLAATRQRGASYTALEAEKQAGVLKMVNAYRVRGHKKAQLDPLGLSHRPEIADLSLGAHGLTDADLDQVFNTGSLHAPSELTLREIVALVEATYCGPIGAEYMHITDTPERRWLQERLEGAAGEFAFDDAAKRSILEHLTMAEGLERYLHTKYVGQKRFSLEGGESLIPLLHGMIQGAGDQGVKEVVMGMAHRGRLNALVNILGKSPKELFEEFEGKVELHDERRSGDVKYHMGFSSELDTPGGRVHVAMGFNPSHLEIIDPVVAGSARARQTRRNDRRRQQVLPILIHGDAAFAGQGVVMELFNMSQARGFAVGGTVHVIVNNQIGFTTSNPLDARSTLYCTEVAKMVQAPILHVNGDDPEAVMFCMQLALDYRMTFNKDVVLDLVCYRRHGHNEADEPAATQPVMYRKVRSMTTTRELYAERLLDAGVMDEDGVKQMQTDYRDALDAGHPVAEIHDGPFESEYIVDWSTHLAGTLDEEVDTTVEPERVIELANKLQELPEGFELHARVQRIMDDRAKMAAGELRMDWGFAETMAYASLLDEGYEMRLVGQDSGRGTFFHRHAILHNQADATTYAPLESFSDNPNAVTIIDSLLSEEAVLGFEYGYASSEPETLVIWEAQFGDFVNGAQVVIDQFISSGEAKWGRMCGLTMFLPHGYEGQGPEHSSARLERFMQLCAQNNMQVAVPTTPAQMFHLLRRQMLRKVRKPLIVMTPKSLLRNKASTSTLSQLSEGRFRTLIPDRFVKETDEVERLVLCSGKVFYDLALQRERLGHLKVPLARVEQLYPFPRDLLVRELARFPNVKEVVWCQEEPRNQGAWYEIKHHLKACIGDNQRLLYAGRARSAAPAVGHYALHAEQQQALVEAALSVGGGQDHDVE
ncbi:MAG: 2-oxoglutarate dehydrogenase E1 component [Xanthomonadales bacterium]|nr:2-oxoglutarate dehydrogenase E1 component [Xanthomonadales bacterium]